MGEPSEGSASVSRSEAFWGPGQGTWQPTDFSPGLTTLAQTLCSKAPLKLRWSDRWVHSQSIARLERRLSRGAGGS